VNDNRGDHSYFRDLVLDQRPDLTLRSSTYKGGTRDDARERLTRHAAEMDIELPKRAAGREMRALRQIEAAEEDFRRTLPRAARRALDRQDFNPFERRVAPNRTDGQGGYFVAPLWLGEYIAGLRPGGRQRTCAGRWTFRKVPTRSTSRSCRR
jgi:hypothetical protein